MLKYLRTQKAQAVIGEYVLVFFLVMGMVTAMTIYFKRAIQARIYEARNAMLNMVINRAQDYYNSDISIQIGYEPYYGNTVSTVARQEDTRINLLPGGTTGNFYKTIDETTSVQTQSETAAPRDAN